jgi:hypothetical protein
MIDHHYSRATVQQFKADAQKALARMGELKGASALKLASSAARRSSA